MPSQLTAKRKTSHPALELKSVSFQRRYFLKKIVETSVGAMILQVLDFGRFPQMASALAQSSVRQDISPFNFDSRLMYDYLSPVFRGIGEGEGEFARSIGQAGGSIVRGIGEGEGEFARSIGQAGGNIVRGIGEAGGNVARGIGEGLRERLRDILSNSEAKQKLYEYSQNQNTQIKRELIELIRDSIREFQAEQIELKIKEIQSNWDLENWNGIINRQETEDILKEQKDSLLILLSPPKISPDAPSSIRNNFGIEVESVGTFLTQYYPVQDQQHSVKFYSGYFKRPVNDINLEQLHKILSPLPTAIFYTDITDYTCTIHIGYWGIKNSKVSKFSSKVWNWERAKKALISQGNGEIEAIRMIRQSMVISNNLLVAYLADLYYLNLDPYYQPQFPTLTSELAQEGLPQEFIKHYVDELQDIQKQIQQVYNLELKITADEVKEQETIKSNAQKWRFVRTLSGHSSSVYSVAISPDGETLASGSSDYNIILWNLKTGEVIRTLAGHSSYVLSVVFTPTGETLVSGSWDDTIKLWNLKLYTLTGHSSDVNSIAISPDGETLASGSDDKTIKLWNLKTRQLLRTLVGHSSIVRSVAISPDEETLASGSDDKTIKIWNLKTGQLLRTLVGHSSIVRSVAISPDGRMIASGSQDTTIKLWNPKTGQLLRTLVGHSSLVCSVAISPDGRMIASGSQDTTIKLWNPKTGELLRTLEGHSSPVYSIAFSPDGHTLVSGSYDNTVQVWQNS